MNWQNNRMVSSESHSINFRLTLMLVVPPKDLQVDVKDVTSMNNCRISSHSEALKSIWLPSLRAIVVTSHELAIEGLDE